MVRTLDMAAGSATSRQILCAFWYDLGTILHLRAPLLTSRTPVHGKANQN